MQYFVYVLENQADQSWYVGFTTNPEERITQHNKHAGGQYTKNKIGRWVLIYCEIYLDKLDAVKREKFLKSGSGRNFLRKQLSCYLQRP
jgi:putative endonuclease